MENKTGSSNVSDSDLLKVYSLLKSSSFSLPSSVRNLLENYSGDHYSTARSGCNDPFAIFGFLAFLLVLLQLLANNGGGRKKRSTRFCSHHEESNQLKEGRLAVHLVFQGFLNSLSEGIGILKYLRRQKILNQCYKGGDLSCKQRSLCEGLSEAAKLGEVGSIVALVSSVNAPGWFHFSLRRRRELGRAGEAGARGERGDCSRLYPCLKHPEHYRFPAVPHNLTTWNNNLDELKSYF